MKYRKPLLINLRNHNVAEGAKCNNYGSIADLICAGPGGSNDANPITAPCTSGGEAITSCTPAGDYNDATSSCDPDGGLPTGSCSTGTANF